MAGEESGAEISPEPAVNNFVAARFFCSPFRMVLTFGFHYPCQLVFRSGGPGLLTTSRFNDFELIDQPAGAV